jgi:hypothetical protein
MLTTTNFSFISTPAAFESTSPDRIRGNGSEYDRVN